MTQFLHPQDVENIKSLAPLVTAFGSGMASLASIFGIKRWIGGLFAGRRQRKEERRQRRAEEALQRAKWYMQSYRRLVITGDESETEFHAMTVQQVCACLNEIPDWVTAGWARVKVGDLNVPTTKPL